MDGVQGSHFTARQTPRAGRALRQGYRSQHGKSILSDGRQTILLKFKAGFRLQGVGDSSFALPERVINQRWFS